MSTDYLAGFETCERCGNGNFLCEYCCAAHGTSGTYSFPLPGPALPTDARDRIERVLRVQGVASGSVEGAADRIMRALTAEVAAGSSRGGES